MYQIRNGILHKDGKKVFALGQSYYPSFHFAKYPVPPDGDRIGQMKKDLAMMAKMGFNHVRFAALGTISLMPDGSVSVDTGFVDSMVAEAIKNEISSSVRLQGYAINLRGHKNALMIDNLGNEQDTTRWADFIQTSLHHSGMMEDNDMGTRALAQHFGEQDGVVGFQIYNEPHYPSGNFFDYHPAAIAAYREHLVKIGVLSPEEAANYDPPRNRKEDTPHMWALWRLFCRDSLTRMLRDSSDTAKAAGNLPTFTAGTTDQLATATVFRGFDLLKFVQRDLYAVFSMI